MLRPLQWPAGARFLPPRLADEAGAYTDANVGVRHAPDGTNDRTCTLDGQYMLSWFFKKRGDGDAPTVSPSATTEVARQPSARPTIPTAIAKTRPVEDTGTDWPAQLGAAHGDDVALLCIAQSAPVLGIKMAAVEALATESALRQAEREFRSHDRKVHRLAKQRLEVAVAQREARASAQTLLERTTALLDEAVVPINHVVDLDRDWEALPTTLLEPGQRERFAELRARLDAAIRERSDEQQRLRRWTADARRFLLEWQRSIVAAADHGGPDDVAVQSRAIEMLREARPDVPATTELDLALAQALQCAALVQARLAWFDALPPDAADPTTAPAATPAQRWNEMPPLPDGELARVLNQRHERWLHAHQPARPLAAVSPPTPASKPPQSGDAATPSAEQRLRFESLMQQAEHALAEGHLGETQRRLQAIDAALGPLNAAALTDESRARLQALRSEGARLKGWQQWGGGRARDDLTAEAEDLARHTLATADPSAAGVPKLNLKAHGERIHALRARWKELDRLGAASSLALWQRFDAALQLAYQPISAQHAALKVARQDNLAAREALLAALDALPLPEPSVQPGDPAVDWRSVMRELDRFKLAWRKLGPIEHTVPSKARDSLQQRLRGCVDRIEAPLQSCWQAAAALREQLIARAEALVPEVGRHPHMPDAARQVRELQAEWQGHARQLPMPRATEGALWARFRAATDAVFAQRKAASAALDAELAANLATREALLDRLSALRVDTPVAGIERALAEVDRAWRQAGDVPRGASEVIEGRFREARAAAAERLKAAAREGWQAQCDALAARLALCEEREAANGSIADFSPRWAAQAALPAAWDRTLTLRWARPGEPGPLAEAAVDELLLRLETALNLPIAPERQAERRNLKLRALKDSMEGRATPDDGPAQQAEWLLAMLWQSGLTPVQRERLRAVVAALRLASPGSLGSPTNTG